MHLFLFTLFATLNSNGIWVTHISCSIWHVTNRNSNVEIHENLCFCAEFWIIICAFWAMQHVVDETFLTWKMTIFYFILECEKCFADFKCLCGKQRVNIFLTSSTNSCIYFGELCCACFCYINDFFLWILLFKVFISFKNYYKFKKSILTRCWCQYICWQDQKS